MSATDLDRRFALACAVAREAGAIALAAFRNRSHLPAQEAGGWTNDFLRGDGLRLGNPVLACTPALKDVLWDTMDVAESR
jgi:hypothetical protein